MYVRVIYMYVILFRLFWQIFGFPFSLPCLYFLRLRNKLKFDFDSDCYCNDGTMIMIMFYVCGGQTKNSGSCVYMSVP